MIIAQNKKGIENEYIHTIFSNMKLNKIDENPMTHLL